jgi:hypothetical protein
VALWATGLVGRPQDSKDVRSNFASPATDEEAGLSARLDLPTQSIAGGGTLNGTVTVQNNTGQSKSVVGCGALFQVVLRGDQASQAPSGFACAVTFVIPPGTSEYPVTIKATYSQCAPEAQGIPQCRPDGTPPALPAGTYHADVVVPDGITMSVAATDAIQVAAGS